MKCSESGGRDLDVKFGSQGVWCHIHSRGIPLQGTSVKALRRIAEEYIGKGKGVEEDVFRLPKVRGT